MGKKQHYVYDRTGALLSISTREHYFKELNKDLLGGRALTNLDYSVVLDKRDANAGMDPVSDYGTINAANSFPFVGEYSGDLFYL